MKSRRAYRLRPSSKQRIAMIAALRHWESHGRPMPSDFRQTHQIESHDVRGAIELLESAPMGRICIIVQAGRSDAVACDYPQDVDVHVINSDLDAFAHAKKMDLSTLDASRPRVIGGKRSAKRIRGQTS